MTKTLMERLNNVLTYNEILCIKAINKELGGARDKVIKLNALTNDTGLTRSIFVGATRLLEVAGVLETRSLGTKGTHFKILDPGTLEKI